MAKTWGFKNIAEKKEVVAIFSFFKWTIAWVLFSRVPEFVLSASETSRISWENIPRLARDVSSTSIVARWLADMKVSVLMSIFLSRTSGHLGNKFFSFICTFCFHRMLRLGYEGCHFATYMSVPLLRQPSFWCGGLAVFARVSALVTTNSKLLMRCYLSHRIGKANWERNSWLNLVRATGPEKFSGVAPFVCSQTSLRAFPVHVARLRDHKVSS